MNKSARIRVVIADDHDLVRQGIRAFLETQSDITIVGEAGDALAAAKVCARTKPDVVLLDMVMPGGGGVAALRQIAIDTPTSRSVVLTSFDRESDIRQALAAGALSYVLKDIGAEALADVIRKAHRGQAVLHAKAAAVLTQSLRSAVGPVSGIDALSAREREVLQCIAQGLSNGQIAERLGIGDKTEKTHVSNLLSKLELTDRTQVAVQAWKQGWVARP